ncbi:acyltransferase family protein [Seleniivibrio sp.]|uniref:acyltransferase family protein n=1 Tax=Seleniivibrio sp. TaxID=2898801 RepID=UPI0025E925CC|nr:acyltransferase family protein [Seleniivibrio sp.]MCD8553363.1 acyltransferase [Seleniivibrio sp.]
MKYRKDIDGLRSIAILPVILYHAGISVFSGGFIGVDVFFVISGYLITSIIYKELVSGTFTIANFYVRRVKRIFPALFAMIAVTGLLSYFFLLPSHFEKFGKSAAAAVFFCANIVFWGDSGYFETAAESKPLLHTWSLGVEEQFYIFFPLMLMFLAKRGFRHLKTIIISIFIISFLLNVLCIKMFPSAVFFNLPFRAWEMMLGAMLALGFFPSAEGLKREISGVSGLLLIAAGIFLIDENTRFPGYAALLPCVGTALIIHAEGSAVNRVLSLKPLVWIGLLSYSLYIWHWPLFAFRNYISAVEFRSFFLTNTFLIPAVFALAIFSYYVIEKPLRTMRVRNKKQLFAYAAACMGILCLPAIYVEHTNGMSARFPKNVIEASTAKMGGLDPKKCFDMEYEDITKDKLCRIGGKNEPTFALIGDSHALAMSSGMDALLKKTDTTGLLFARSTCAPTNGADVLNGARYLDCSKYIDKALEVIISEPSVKTVFLTARWGMYANNKRYLGTTKLYVVKDDKDKGNPYASDGLLYQGLKGTIARLNTAGINAVVILDVPDIGFDVPVEAGKYAMMKQMFGERVGKLDYDFSSSTHYAWAKDFNDMIASLSKEVRFSVIDPSEFLCRNGECELFDGMSPLYFDSNHLSTHGSLFVANMMAPKIQSAIKNSDKF